MAQNTRTVRIRYDTYEEAVKLMDREKDKKTPQAEVYTESETSWITYMVKLGMKRYKSNRKESVE